MSFSAAYINCVHGGFIANVVRADKTSCKGVTDNIISSELIMAIDFYGSLFDETVVDSKLVNITCVNNQLVD